MKTLDYRGYTIQEDPERSYSQEAEFVVFPTDQGIQHDADYDGDGYKYCGNCKWCDSIEEGMETIDLLIEDELRFDLLREQQKNTRLISELESLIANAKAGTITATVLYHAENLLFQYSK